LSLIQASYADFGLIRKPRSILLKFTHGNFFWGGGEGRGGEDSVSSQATIQYLVRFVMGKENVKAWRNGYFFCQRYAELSFVVALEFWIFYAVMIWVYLPISPLDSVLMSEYLTTLKYVKTLQKKFCTFQEH